MISQRTQTKYRRSCWRHLSSIVFVFLCLTTFVSAQSLTELQYRLTGLGLDVFPDELTVPRDIATQLNTRVIGGETLPAGAAVRATLRGPSFQNPVSITSTPGEPILLPAFSQPGIHFLEEISLEVNSELSLQARPSEVTINVIDELLVGSVSSRPLTLEEITNLGIEFDENSFQAFSFTIAFTTASGVIELNVPVLIPIVSGFEMLVGSQIPGINLAQLPQLELEVPNLSIQPAIPGRPKSPVTRVQSGLSFRKHAGTKSLST